jgi:hypothetical protein
MFPRNVAEEMYGARPDRSALPLNPPSLADHCRFTNHAKRFATMSSRDAHDLAIMRRELSASRHADASIVAHDIRGRRHEANVAAQWITTRARKHKEAHTQGEQFNEALYLREHLDIGISTMQTWIVILRNWPLYARRRDAAGVTEYLGASYARSLIQDESDECGTNPRPPGSHSAHGHDRLRDAVARATHLQGLYDRAAAVVVRR